MKSVIPITAIWLRGKDSNTVQVLAEINDKWYIVMEEHIDTSVKEAIAISHIAEGNGRKNWKEDTL